MRSGKKRAHFFALSAAAFFFLFLTVTIYADDEWRWKLVNALSQNDLEAAEKIISENAKTMTAADRRLALNFAITYGYGDNSLKVLQILQSNNIRSDSYNLYVAINRNQPDNVIQFLIDSGVKANGEILLLAMEKQKFNIAKQFIESGVDVNYSYPAQSKNYDGMTAIIYACKWNNFDLVKLLAEKGAKLNTRNKDGNSALSIARANENIQIYDYLTSKGAVEGTIATAAPQPEGGNFQPGTYRLINGSTTRKFTGSAVSGSVSYVSDGLPSNGFYMVNGTLLSLNIGGRTYLYSVDSSSNLTGNGEVWARLGN